MPEREFNHDPAAGSASVPQDAAAANRDSLELPAEVVDIDTLAEHFVDRLRAGEFPAISDYVSNYPGLAAEIEELFPTLAMLENFGAEDPDSTLDLGAGSVSVPNRLGEYLVVREVGRGGMGIVYEAEHETMRRRVALKVLQSKACENKSHLQRFYREARAAGRLHHTNIVPIFEVGEAEGIHFYAMQFIRGQNLDVVLEELKRWKGDSTVCLAGTTENPPPLSESVARGLLTGEYKSAAPESLDDSEDEVDQTASHPDGRKMATLEASSDSESWRLSESTATMQMANSSTESDVHGESYFRRVARIGLQIADALQYAHGHGVLHRDIKPSNLILDTAGVVWITDFGLAKHQGDDLTQTGDLVGTLRYMAPERFRGDSNERSDLYGLGLTLYELSTLTVAFNKSDRAELIRQVTQDEPLRPRRVDSQIPRDLETIILKLIDKQPQHRYYTARHVAEDLRLFLADRPIQARRTSLGERLWRWCRRNPQQATLAGCVLLLLSVIVTGSLVFGYVMGTQARRLEASEQRAMESLYQYSIGQAQAGRWSGQPGQHFQGLEAIGRAAEILPRLTLDPSERGQQRLRLRNQAIACMPLVDLRKWKTWEIEERWQRVATLDADGQRMARADQQGHLVVTDIATEEQLFHLKHPYPSAIVDEIKFTADGRWIVGRYYRKPYSYLLVWKLARAETPLEIELARKAYAQWDLYPNEAKVLGESANGELVTFDLETGDACSLIQIPEGMNRIQVSHSGRRLVAATIRRRQVQVWDLEKSEKAWEATLPRPGWSVAWRAGDSMIAVGTQDGPIHLYEPRVGGRFSELNGHLSRVTQVQFIDHGKYLVSGAWDGTDRVWQVATGKQLLRFKGVQFTDCGFGDGVGQYLLASSSSALSLWELSQDSPLTLIRSPDFEVRRWGTGFGFDGQVMASARDDGVELWDVADARRIARLPAPLTNDGISKDALFVSKDSLLVTSDAGGLRKWPLQRDGNHLTIGPPEQINSRTGWVSTDLSREWLAFRKSMRSLKGKIIDLSSETLPVETAGHAGIDHVQLSPDRKWVATTVWNGSGIQIWNARTGKKVVKLEPGVARTKAAFSPDSRLLAGSSAEDQVIWEVGTWQERYRWSRDVDDGWPGPVAFSPDCRLIAMSHSRFLVKLVDPRTGETLCELDADSLAGFSDCEFSPDGGLLAASSDMDMHIWDLRKVRQRLGALGLDWEHPSILPAEDHSSQPWTVEILNK